MASKEHQQLAAFIKEVHQDLRYQSLKHGAQEAWKLHCDQHEILTKYADAMKQLATKYWDVNAADENTKAKSRIEWVVARCLDYFVGGVKLKERMKEDNKLIALCRTVSLQSNNVQQREEINNDILGNACPEDESSLDAGLYLLDVGSCYNPFKIFPLFKVLPIDLAPASLDVYRCDFFNVQVVPQQCSHVIEEGSVITELPEESFDIVVFSLLLEYIPCSEQRYNCCQKAYNLLKSEGLLFIITPDSKNPSVNAPLMKRWRISLSHLGFVRVFYEKLPHIHCMAYRKAPCREMGKKLWMSQTQKCMDMDATCPEMLMKIPQDFQSYSDRINVTTVIPPVDRTEQDNEVLMNMFLELPNM